MEVVDKYRTNVLVQGGKLSWKRVNGEWRPTEGLNPCPGSAPKDGTAASDDGGLESDRREQ